MSHPESVTPHGVQPGEELAWGPYKKLVSGQRRAEVDLGSHCVGGCEAERVEAYFRAGGVAGNDEDHRLVVVTADGNEHQLWSGRTGATQSRSFSLALNSNMKVRRVFAECIGSWWDQGYCWVDEVGITGFKTASGGICTGCSRSSLSGGCVDYDSNCRSGEMCRNGACVPRECTTNATCATCKGCVNGRCAPIATDARCNGYCTNGSCVTNSGGGGSGGGGDDDSGLSPVVVAGVLGAAALAGAAFIFGKKKQG